MNKIEERLSFFRSLVSCAHDITFTEFNSDLSPVFCSNKQANAIYLFFAIDKLNSLEQMPDITKDDPSYPFACAYPIVCMNSLGMLWISECEFDQGEIKKVHVIGPVFSADYSIQNINARMDKLKIPVSIKKGFLDLVDSLPIVPMIRMYEYGCMLHYCLYDKKIASSDFVYFHHAEEPSAVSDSFGSLAPEQTWLATKKLLSMVENGNLDYQKTVNHLASLGYTQNHTGGFLRQTKNAVIILTALCCQSAISGGLAPSTAYLLSDRYLQAVEESTNISSLGEISKTMLQDYIQRVHQQKCTDSSISPQMKAVCDKLALSPEMKPDMKTLAAEFGYSEYYFSRKFHEETGMSLSQYLMKQKIEKSKLLLKNTALSIQEITDKLNFCSSSYFGKHFRKETGMTPLEYRNKFN